MDSNGRSHQQVGPKDPKDKGKQVMDQPISGHSNRPNTGIIIEGGTNTNPNRNGSGPKQVGNKNNVQQGQGNAGTSSMANQQSRGKSSRGQKRGTVHGKGVVNGVAGEKNGSSKLDGAKHRAVVIEESASPTSFSSIIYDSQGIPIQQGVSSSSLPPDINYNTDEVMQVTAVDSSNNLNTAVENLIPVRDMVDGLMATMPIVQAEESSSSPMEGLEGVEEQIHASH